MISESEWDSPSTHSAFSEGSGSLSTAGGAEPSGGWGGSNSSWEGSDQTWEAGDSDRHRLAMSQLSVAPSGGLTGGAGTTKRARLGTSRSISNYGDARGGAGTSAGRGGGGRGGSGASESSGSCGDGGGDSLGSECGEGSGGLGARDKSASSGSVLEQGYRHPPQSHSTDEWRAVEKAARVLGVDSLEERDVEDRRRNSMVKAARFLGVDNVEEIREVQESAAGHRLRWAPPRSSASKAARTLGIEDVSELQVQASNHRLGRRRSSSVSGTRSKQRQSSISSLIRALEITTPESQQSAGGSQSSGRGEVETNSAHSAHSTRSNHSTHSNHSAHSSATRGTESCSSVSDLTLQDADGAERAAAAARAGITTSHTSNRPELSDDQLPGLQTPQSMAAAENGGSGRRFSRDDMEIETPPSQPLRSAALASLQQAPAPLVAPYTPSAQGTCRSSPSPLGSVGPGPSPAGSPLPLALQLTPRGAPIPPHSMVAVRSYAPDFAMVGGDRSPAFQMGTSANEAVGVVAAATAAPHMAEGKGCGGDKSPALTMVAEGKGRNPPRCEALGDEPDGRAESWRPTAATAAPTSTPAATVGVAATAAVVAGTAHSRAQQTQGARMGSPPATPAPSPIAPVMSWGSGWTAPPTLRAAGAKESHAGRFGGMEFKQEAPIGTTGEWGSPTTDLADLASGNGQGEWRSRESKPELHNPAPGMRGTWSIPARPSSAPIQGAQPQQPPLSGRYSPGISSVSGEPPRPTAPTVFGGRSGVYPGLEHSIVGSESSCEGSESTSDACPDRMDEGDGCGGHGGGGATSAYEELAAMIPFINPSGIGSGGSAVAPVTAPVVKVEDGRAAPGGAAAKAKTRRRGPKTPSPWSDESGAPVAVSPLLTRPDDARSDGGAAAGDNGGENGGVPGISTRKQQEVATRPRERGRFIKRPPAFLPISAFKPAGDRTEADMAAERAEEAREEAVEAAARAAAAAAAAAAGQRAGNSSVSSGMSDSTPTPTTVEPLGKAGIVHGDSAPMSTFGGRGGTGAGAGDNFISSDSITRQERVGLVSGGMDRSSLVAGPSVRAGRAGSFGVSRRGERGMSPPPRTPHTDIWTSHDGEHESRERRASDQNTNPDGGGGGMMERTRSESDCGSERGSDDLRGMAFLPFSPMDGPSPRSAWDSPRRSVFSASGSASSTPSHSHRHGRSFGASPRSVPQLATLAVGSADGGSPWQGAREGDAGADTGHRVAEHGRH